MPPPLPRYYAAAAPADTRAIPIHTVLPMLGGLSALAGAAFSAVVVLLPPGPSEYGRLKYISQGMAEHCGWTGVVMGTTGSLVALCMLVPALHLGWRSAIACVFLQLVGWNVVLGVADTGWTIHYVGLGVFVAAHLTFHFLLSDPKTSMYGFPSYRVASALSVLVTFIFVAAFAVASCYTWGTEAWRLALDVAVCCEFALMLTITANTLCLMVALNAYASAHLLLDKVCLT